MGDPNELLEKVRKLDEEGMGGIHSGFPALDTECMAGNLPDEWIHGAIAKYVKKNHDQQERITVLEKSLTDVIEEAEEEPGRSSPAVVHGRAVLDTAKETK